MIPEIRFGFRVTREKLIIYSITKESKKPKRFFLNYNKKIKL